MRFLRAKLGLLATFVVLASLSPSSAVQVAQTGQGPTLASIGPLTFGPDGTLFTADNQGAAIFALDLGAQANGGAAGAKGLDALDEKLAALLGTGAREISVTDLAVHPRTHNAYVSVMRGQGAGSAPVLFRIDGAGQIANVSLQTLKFQKVELPNPPPANAAARSNPPVIRRRSRSCRPCEWCPARIGCPKGMRSAMARAPAWAASALVSHPSAHPLSRSAFASRRSR